MPKPLTVELIQKEATRFAKAESKHAEPSLFGVTCHMQLLASRKEGPGQFQHERGDAHFLDPNTVRIQRSGQTLDIKATQLSRVLPTRNEDSWSIARSHSHSM